MSSLSVWTMVAVCGFVWGGFGTLLVFAFRNEVRKRRDDGDRAR